MSAIVLVVFPGQASRAVMMQPKRQLQWTATDTTSENLRTFFSEKQHGVMKTDRKIYSRVLLQLFLVATTFTIA